MNSSSTEKINLLYVFVGLISFIKKAKKHLSISILVGLLLGTLHYMLKTPIYKSQLSAFSTYLNNEQISDVMLDLSKLVKEKDITQLQQKTGMSASTLKKVVSINCKPIVTLETLKNENGGGRDFNITVEVVDVIILDTLERGLLFYLENNPYINKHLKLKLEGIDLDMNKISREINNLSALQLDLQNLLRNDQNKSNLFLSDVGNISSQLVELFQKYNGLKYDKQYAGTDVRVIKSFTKFKHQTSPNLILSLAGGIIICLSVGIFAYFLNSLLIIIKEVEV